MILRVSIGKCLVLCFKALTLLNHMNIVITGGTGFLGGHTLASLSQTNHKVVALHRREQSPSSCKVVRWVKSGFDRPNWDEILLRLGGSPQVLIHLAAHGTSPKTSDWPSCFEWNVMKTLDFFLAAISHGVSRIIICGSCFEYGATANKFEFIPVTAAPQPLDAYAASKAAATMMLHGIASTHGIEGLILRPCVIYGEGEPPTRLWPSLREAALKGENFLMTSGLQVRDFIPVTNVANAIVSAVTRKDLIKGRAFIENLGSGNPQSVRDFASEWWNKWGGTGSLLFGHRPDRENETMRFVPEI